MKVPNSPHNIEYNSQQETIIIPEYGRNVQRLIFWAKTLENKEEQQAAIDEIVNLILLLQPQSKNIEDYRDKLWKHIYKIANYELTAIPPGMEIPKPFAENVKPDPIGYPHRDTMMRHYGFNVQKMIEKAIAMEDGDIKQGFVQAIGSYMKLAFKTWNKEHFVSDDIIKDDLVKLSKGKLSLEETEPIEDLSQGIRPNRGFDNRNNNNNRYKKFNNKQRNKNNNNNRDNNNRRRK